LVSDILRERIRMKVSMTGLRTIDKRGGIDRFLLSTPNRKLEPVALKLKRRIKRVQANLLATPAA
jgi:large subunit ribosomal protein L28